MPLKNKTPCDPFQYAFSSNRKRLQRIFFEDQDKVEKSIYNATLIGTDGAASIARKMMFERTLNCDLIIASHFKIMDIKN